MRDAYRERAPKARASGFGIRPNEVKQLIKIFDFRFARFMIFLLKIFGYKVKVLGTGYAQTQ